MRSALFGFGASLALTIAGVVGCVSEHASGPGVDLAACSARLPSEAFGSTIVIIRNQAFAPAAVRVRPGTKVTWLNCEAVGTEFHTSTADGGLWSSPLLAPGATFTQEFATTGAFAYHCTPHPGMVGTVTVE